VILPDVNILLYAFRKDTPQHKRIHPWLTSIVVADAPFGVSRLALSAFVRIATNRRIYLEPSSLDECFAFCETLAAQPNCRVIEPGERHWSIFERLCRETDTVGALVTDAWFAALAIEQGCEWVTLDRDYARFPGLKWRTPDAG
jgi:toxin-antitoxin system PIN domain toxin